MDSANFQQNIQTSYFKKEALNVIWVIGNLVDDVGIETLKSPSFDLSNLKACEDVRQKFRIEISKTTVALYIDIEENEKFDHVISDKQIISKLGVVDSNGNMLFSRFETTIRIPITELTNRLGPLPQERLSVKLELFSDHGRDQFSLVMEAKHEINFDESDCPLPYSDFEINVTEKDFDFDAEICASPKMISSNYIQKGNEGSRATKFKVHKLILGSRSTVFDTLFKNGNFKENENNTMTIRDLKTTTVKTMLNFIYNGKLDSQKVDEHLLNAAEKYDLPDLKRMCEEHICNNSLTTDTFLDTWILLDNYHCSEQNKQKMIHFAIKNWKTLKDSKDCDIIITKIGKPLMDFVHNKWELE